ncbi:uncharacterized protein LOC114751460 [Neltuma alba]|uniref:uncharacterized protein LOC114751460 n=1 Tax=Neltuma alba TaxID=207710 RepID=UPI0010A35162|nr:uncharacterized protein LOC114751460 [Prosopis alba]
MSQSSRLQSMGKTCCVKQFINGARERCSEPVNGKEDRRKVEGRKRKQVDNEGFIEAKCIKSEFDSTEAINIDSDSSDDDDEEMQIPPAFIKEFGKEEVPKKTTLETYNGKFWEVGVEKLGRKFYFDNGWDNFVRVNSLENGDFLLFKYFADYSKFNVKIYGKTCCEKQLNVVGERCTQKRKAQTVEVKRNEKYGGRMPPDYHNHIEFESENPFFQHKLMPTTANQYLYIPKGFFKERMKESKRIKLELSERTWNMEIYVHERERDAKRTKDARVVKGWKRLVNEHHLEIGDVCFFEMIASYYDSDCSEFLVHVYSDLHLLAKASMDRASQWQRKRKKPSFFKILIQDFSTRLQIPPAFYKVFGKEVPKKAILETCYVSEDETINIDSDSSQHPIVEEEVGNSKQPTSEEATRLPTDNQTESESSSFQVKLRSSSINSYLENERQEIRIEMTNKVWEVGVLVFWADGKKEALTGARLTQGWRNLVSECRLQMGDVCNFELIQPTAHHQQLVFRLRVLRWDPQNDKFTQIL